MMAAAAPAAEETNATAMPAETTAPSVVHDQISHLGYLSDVFLCGR